MAYLFEARNLDGTPLNGEIDDLDETDSKVRDIFTTMISDFVRHGKIQIEGKDVPSFSPKGNDFVSISAKPKLLNNFKYCEMALWAGLTQRLQSASCQYLDALSSTLKLTQDTIRDKTSSVNTQLTKNIQQSIKTVDSVTSGNNRNKNPNDRSGITKKIPQLLSGDDDNMSRSALGILGG